MADPETLRLAVAAWTFVPGEMGGTETYARELLHCLTRREDVQVTVLVSRSATGILPCDREVVGAARGGSASAGSRVSTVVRALRPDRTTRSALDRAEVVHHPFTVPLPRGGGPRVQALHDVQHLDLPEFFSTPERTYRRLLYDAPATRADAVITLSAFSRDRIVHHLGVPAERVHVAHLGIDPTRFDSVSERDQFVLYPARGWPHKNHPRLLAAMELVRRIRPELRLVLTGGGLEELGELPAWGEDRGRISTEELHALYARAACLAFPSLYEGFGLPPLEAMASGCPVTASRSGAIPEVCGDAAVLVDGADVTSIARGIEDALASAPTLRERGRAWVRRFTWEACADVHMSAYRQAMGRSALG